MDETDTYRCRHIHLKHNINPGLQAPAACKALAGLDGILLVSAHGDFDVHVVYRLDQLSLEILIDLLIELGFELDDSFSMSLRNSLYCYLEDNVRDQLHSDRPEEETPDALEGPDLPRRDKNRYWDDYH